MVKHQAGGAKPMEDPDKAILLTLTAAFRILEEYS
jgi:hypothetical protein